MTTTHTPTPGLDRPELPLEVERAPTVERTLYIYAYGQSLIDAYDAARKAEIIAFDQWESSGTTGKRDKGLAALHDLATTRCDERARTLANWVAIQMRDV